MAETVFVVTGWKYGEPYHSVHKTLAAATSDGLLTDDNFWYVYESKCVDKGYKRTQAELVSEAVDGAYGLINAIKRLREFSRDEFGTGIGYGLAESKQLVEDYLVENTKPPTRQQAIAGWKWQPKPPPIF